MSALAWLAPFLAGLLVGINPYTAPLVKARLTEKGVKRATLEAALGACALALLVGLVAWEFAPFVSGRLTNGLLLLGLFTLAGAVFALRPVGRHRGPAAAPPTGARWVLRYAGDAFYFLGPAWLVATAVAMRAIRPAAFALPYALATLGAIIALIAWSTRGRERLPGAPPRPGEPIPRSTRALAFAYGAAGVLVLAGYEGLIR